MSYIPDVTRKMDKGLFSKEETPNYYWEGYLSDEDAQQVLMFDLIIQEVIENIDLEEIEDFVEPETDDEDIAIDEIRLMAKKNDAFNECIKGYLIEKMMEARNDCVIAMLDDQDSETFINIRHAVDEEGHKNCIIAWKEDNAAMQRAREEAQADE